MSIGSRIKYWRLKNNLTQKQLGDLCGMADSAIRRYESDRGNPTGKTLQRIAGALGVPLTDLLMLTIDLDSPQSSHPLSETFEDMHQRIAQPFLNPKWLAATDKTIKDTVCKIIPETFQRDSEKVDRVFDATKNAFLASFSREFLFGALDEKDSGD